MPPQPLVSVMIPTYNYARFLDEAIQSVLAQTFTDFTLTIVDNCSTDNTAAVVQPYLADPRVIFHRNEKNLGLVGNWNKCLELAKGPYIKMLCADDKLHPQMLERFVAVMEAHPTVSIATSYNKLFGNETIERRMPYSGLVNGSAARATLVKANGHNWLNNPSATMFRGSSVKIAGRFHTSLHQTIDKEYYVRLLSIGDCYVLPEFLSYVRSHDETQSAHFYKQEVEQVVESYRYFKVLLEEPDMFRLENEPELRKLMKGRAMYCTKMFYRNLPQFLKPGQRPLLKKMFAVGYSEGILVSALTALLKDKFRKKPAKAGGNSARSLTDLPQQ